MDPMRFPWIAALFLVGCSPAQYAERATDAGSGRAWITGSGGLAVFYDGQRHPRNYPLEKSNSRYEVGTYPAAQVLERAGETYLFTRTGEVYRWDGGRWGRLAIRWKGMEDPYLQVDEVQLLSDGRWLIHLHPDVLLLATHEGFLASKFEELRLPGYCSWVGEVGGQLYGAGWDAGGNQRAVHRREGERWRSWTLPAKDVHGVVRTPRSEVAAVVPEGLLIFEREGEAIAPVLWPILEPRSYLVGLYGEGKIRVIGQHQGLLEVGPRGLTFWAFEPSDSAPVGVWAGPSGFLGVSSQGVILRGARRALPMTKELAVSP